MGQPIPLTSSHKAGVPPDCASPWGGGGGGGANRKESERSRREERIGPQGENKTYLDATTIPKVGGK